MVAAVKPDLTDSDFQGLSKTHSDRLQERLMNRQDEQPTARDRWGVLSIVAAITAILVGINAPAIVPAIRQLFN